MPDRSPRARLLPALRSYVAAVLLNLALVNTVLTTEDRPPAAQLRMVAVAPGFRETELVPLGDGTRGVASVPYRSGEVAGAIGQN